MTMTDDYDDYDYDNYDYENYDYDWRLWLWVGVGVQSAKKV